MSTKNLNIEDDFFNNQILIGKTIKEIQIIQDKNDKYITIYFSDLSCLELVLNETSDIFYMESIND